MQDFAEFEAAEDNHSSGGEEESTSSYFFDEHPLTQEDLFVEAPFLSSYKRTENSDIEE